MRGFALGLLVVLSFTACERPGHRASGRADVSFGLTGDSVWHGPCEYEVLTWWDTPFRHLVRFEDAASDRTLVLQSTEPFRDPGNRTLRPGSENATARLMAGHSVEAGVIGAIQVSEENDSTSIVLIGHRVRRDTIPLQARCRLGVLDTG